MTRHTTADEREVIEAAGQYRVAVIANDAHPTQASAARRENALTALHAAAMNVRGDTP